MRSRLFTHSLAAAAAAAVSAALTIGCVAPNSSHDMQTVSPASQEVTLAVVNRNLDDVRVYVLRGSIPVPLGTVAGMQSRSFRISPAELGGSRALCVSVVASPSRARIAMVPVDVGPGQTVEAWIATNLPNSNIRILPNLP